MDFPYSIHTSSQTQHDLLTPGLDSYCRPVTNSQPTDNLHCRLADTFLMGELVA